jgi:hypothetical protein
MSLDRFTVSGQQSCLAIVPRPRSGPSAPPGTASLHPRIPEDPGAQGWLAVWCSSVGTTWTLELHEPTPDTTLGPLVDWISSGIPTSQPGPDKAKARALLAERGLHLCSETPVGPCTHSRRSIGYVSADSEVITQAHRVRDAAAGARPVLRTAQRLTAASAAHSLSARE